MKVEVIKHQKPSEVELTAAKAEQPPEQAAAGIVVKGKGKNAKRKQYAKKWELGHPGLRLVFFAIDIELWNEFVASCCGGQKPNVVVTRMIRGAIQAKNPSISNANTRGSEHEKNAPGAELA